MTQPSSRWRPGHSFAVGLVLFLAAALLLMQVPMPQRAQPQFVDGNAPQPTVGQPHGEQQPSQPAQVYGPGAPDTPKMPRRTVVTAEIPEGSLALPAIIVEFLDPTALKKAWDESAYAKELKNSALGRGLFGTWAPLLGSHAEDLNTTLKGALGELLLSEVLTEPFQLVWFQGPSSRGIPALVMPSPSGAANAALSALDVVAGSDITANACPPIPEEPSPSEEAAAGDGGAVAEKEEEKKEEEERPAVAEVVLPSGPFTMRAYRIAETTFVASHHEGKLVLGATTGAVLTALCAPIPAMEKIDGAALALSVVPENLGRDAEVLAALTGVKGALRMAFSVDGGTLKPRGMFGQLEDASRLVDAPTNEQLLTLLPESTGILLTLNLKLPEKLDADSINTLMAGGTTPTKARQVSFIFNPHGSSKTVEAAIIWGDVSDEPQLKSLFSSGGLDISKACDHVILASTSSVTEQLQGACGGRIPSLKHAAGPVVAGLKGPGAMTLSIHAGRVLSRIADDGYQLSGKGDHSDEMKEATRLLQAIPVVGFKARIQEKSLKGEGFRS